MGKMGQQRDQYLLLLHFLGCVISWKADGFCDDGNNIEECEFDGGDCCGSNVLPTFCNECQCLNPGE